MLYVFRNGPPDVSSKKDAPQTRSKLIGDQPCRDAISVELPFKFIEITTTHGFTVVKRNLFTHKIITIMIIIMIIIT